MFRLTTWGALLLIIVHGLALGWWSDRWSTPADLEAAADRLHHFPNQFAGWESKAIDVPAAVLRAGDFAGAAQRVFIHPTTKQTISVMVVCGRAGPISVHPPEVCFQGAGHHLVVPATKCEWSLADESETAELNVADFLKPDPAAPSLSRVFWSWNNGSGWRAPSNPRWTFASSRILYKIYFVRPLAASEEPVANDPVRPFLRLLVPELNKVLFDQN